MVNSPPILETILTDSWVAVTWEDFLTFADDPMLVNGRFYYDEGSMMIEISPLGSAHGQIHSITANLIILYATIKNITIKGLINTSFRKIGIRGCQPDMAFYIGNNLNLPPRNNAPVNLDKVDPPTLVIEIAAYSLEDDTTRKQKLYQRLGVAEYWVIDVNKNRVIATCLDAHTTIPIQESQVLPGLKIELIELALQKSQTEDDGAINRWLLSNFGQN
ncbi:MAG TPA: Uma2 family endonuclease [Nostocaceae cyanobacterium]|nr:Uma2 family endonuclease [Nostocaceae cyanobacterium]